MKTEEKSLRQIANEHGIDYPKFWQRVKKLGWSVEEAIAGKREVSQPQKRSSTSYKVQGAEPKGKMLGFRALESDERRILDAVSQSGMTRADWLLDAALAKVDGRVIPQDLFEKVQKISSEPQGWIIEAVRQRLNRHKK